MTRKQSELDVSSRRARRRFFAFYELPVPAPSAPIGGERSRAASYAMAWNHKRAGMRDGLGGSGLAASNHQ